VAIQILRDLRGLRVQVVHPPDNERVRLVEHLRRIGCMVETQWPVPECWNDSCDVMLLAVEHDVRSDIQRLLKSSDGPRPTLIAVVGYEDPSTLQLVLEAGAVAVIERRSGLWSAHQPDDCAQHLARKARNRQAHPQTGAQAFWSAANPEAKAVLMDARD